MKKKLYFVANFHFNMVDNVYAYYSWSSFGDSGKVLHLPLSGFSFMQCKKKDTGKCQAYWRCFCYRKRDYPEYPKRPQIFHRRGFLVTQINTEYSEDISQLRLENDWEQKFYFFFCENEKLTHISLPYNIFFKKTWLGLYFCISDANCFSCHIPWISVVVMTPFCKFHHTYVLNRRCSNFLSLSLFKVNIFCFYYHITFIHSLKFNSLNIDRKSYSDFISNTRQVTINNWTTGSCNGVKKK